MICRNCGNVYHDNQLYCPRCGTAAAGGPTVNQPYPQPKKPRNTKTIVITMALVFLSVAIAAGTTVFIMLKIWSRPLKKADAFQRYKQIVAEDKDDIDRYAEQYGVAPVAVYDINKSGVDDLVYLKAEDGADDGTARVHYATDQDGAVKQYTSDAGRSFCLFYRKSDGALYYYTVDGETVRIDRISPKDGSRLETYTRSYDKDTEAYQYSYSKKGVESDADTAKENYDQLITDINNDDTVIIVTDLDDQDIGEIFRDKPDVVATGSDKALEKFDTGQDTDTDNSATADKTIKPTAAPKPEKISVSEIPAQKELISFLQTFNFAYVVKKDDGTVVREFDFENADEKLAEHIAGHPTCVDFNSYPGEDTIDSWKTNSDPKGKYSESGYCAFEKEKVLWIMQNIFHLSSDEAVESVNKALASDSNEMYEFEKDGKTYLCNVLMGVGGPGYSFDLTAAKYDGEKYYIAMKRSIGGTSMTKSDNSEDLYVEMSYQEIDGKSYWTLYRHLEEAPDWAKTDDAEPTEADSEISSSKPVEEKPDVFGLFAGKYIFTSGAGAWGSTIQLNGDGTFTGSYSDSNMGERGDGYDATVYLCNFSGTFSNPQKVNDYTYSFELSDISYENEPGTEEIVEVGSNARQRRVYTEAYGLDRGTKVINAYTADAPWDELPSGYQSWARLGRIGNDSKELGFKGLYATEPQYGWMGSKEN